MSENGRILPEKVEGEIEEHRRARKDGERTVVEQMFRDALEQYRRNPPPPVATPKGAHYAELPEAEAGMTLAEEWNTYRREVKQLLAEGNEGKYVLIKGPVIVGVFDAFALAYEEGLKRFLHEPMMVKEIRTFEPFLRIRGYNMPWPRSHSQLLPRD